MVWRCENFNTNNTRVNKQNKSVIRGMIGAEIDFIILEYDEVANIAIGSRKDAMKLRAQIELPNLKVNDTIRVRIVGIGVKHIVVDIKVTEIKEDKKYIYGYLMRII